MKIKNYFCLSVFLLLLAGCVDDYVSTSKGQKDAEANPNDFSLQEAHEFFDKAMELAPVTRSGKRLRSDGVSFPTGEFNTLWNNARKGQRKHVVFYDFPIEPQMRYKARRMVKNAKGRKVSQEVRVYQRLMIAKDLSRQKRAVYIVTFIPEAKSSGKVRCEQFMRGKHNGHYSGVVLYLNPYNYRPVRVDRYKNGVQTGGVFLAGDVKDAVSKVAYAQELLGNVQIAQHQLVAPMSFDENQEDNDFGGGGGSWNWDESDLTQTGDGEWTYHGHDAYGNEQDYTVIDTDGDGKPDSIFIDPNPPVDPDPGTEEPDPDWGWGDGEDGNGGDEWETTDPDDSSDGSKDPVDPNPGGGSSGGSQSWIPSYVPQCTDVLMVKNQILPVLQRMGVNIDGVNVVQSPNAFVIGNALLLNGNEIALGDMFFTYEGLDQTSIIWHKFYHIHNDVELSDYESSPLDEPVKLEPSLEMERKIKEYLRNQYERANIDIPDNTDWIQWEYDIFVTLETVKRPQYYANEINAYMAESRNKIPISPEYELEREVILWRHLQMYIISLINNNK